MIHSRTFHNDPTRYTGVVRLLLSWFALVCICGSPVARAADRPNIVLIFIDDLGWRDIGCYGNSLVETPRIDQLAAQGVRFTDSYAAGAVCSPTRCALQSGQNQARIGITDFIPGHWRPFERVITPRPTLALPLATVTVAEAMGAAGYSTGYVGKWHLGDGPGFQPDRQGYDFSAVINGPPLPGRYQVEGRPELNPKPGQYRTDFEADLCIDFIRREKRRNKPFFLMVSPFAVHIPLEAMSEKVEKYRAKAARLKSQLPHPVYAAMIEHCDDMVGRIVDAVEDEGLTERTMIIFTSDNGGLYRRYDYQAAADDTVATQAPLKGEKGSLYEGGVRVPLIVRYPPLTTAGTVCAEPTITYDFYPTFLDLADGSLPENQPIDGHNLTPLLADPTAKLNRSALYWHYPHYHHDRPASSIREQDWKLIEYLDGTDDVELYQLANDMGETRNLAAEKKERVADMKGKLHTWRQGVAARMPIPNPGYNPRRAKEWWSTLTGKPIPSNRRKRSPPTEKDP
jgi:arylsulfatase A